MMALFEFRITQMLRWQARGVSQNRAAAAGNSHIRRYIGRSAVSGQANRQKASPCCCWPPVGIYQHQGLVQAKERILQSLRIGSWLCITLSPVAVESGVQRGFMHDGYKKNKEGSYFSWHIF
jgi:hypothetical protein